MATTTLKNARVKAAAATLTPLFTCHVAKTAVVSSITICNLAATETTFRIALQPLGAAINDAHYIYYDLPISGNNTFIFTGGITVVAYDILSVYSASGNLSFNLFYQENS